MKTKGALVLATWLVCLSWSASARSAPPLGLPGVGGAPSRTRTTLMDGKPLTQPAAQQRPGNFFSWLAQQGRRMWQGTMRLLGRESTPEVRRRVGRMEFPYLGNRPSTKKKRSSFWSRWFPFGTSNK